MTIAGATLALIAAGGGGFALGRGTAERPPAPPTKTLPAPAASPTPAPVLPTVLPPLGRAELIAAASRAADAFAAGQPLPDDVTELAGRDFELRLPFGCPGAPQLGAGTLSAEYDEADEALRVRAEPESWAPAEWLPSPPGPPEAAAAPDAIEGFWIARPWTSSEACPPPGLEPTPQAPPAAAERSLAVAQVFTPDSSRVGRRDGRAYEAVESVAPDAFDGSRGLHLRLRGKLVRPPTGGPVVCRGTGGVRPACLVLVTFDEVSVENPATEATIATWDVSSQQSDLAGTK